MKNSCAVFLMLVVLSTVLLAQKEESLVAQIENEKIIARDFKLRIELSPYIPTNKKIDQHSEREYKNDFVSSLSSFPELTSTDVDILLGSLRDEKTEDTLYSLGINQFTSPIKSEVGWVI